MTTYDANGTVLVNGVKTFPIVLARGPDRGSTTPSGADALNEVIGAGVNFFKVGAVGSTWTSSDTTDTNLWDQAVAARGAYTWVNLNSLSQAQPGSTADTQLQQVITTLKGDPTGSPGLGMWKGKDEPWWSGVAPSALQFAYCIATARGDSSWCAGETPVDSDNLWVTIEAPRGTASDLAPYSSVTDTHGVDDYPVTLSNPSPNLHDVGTWTSTIASITPSQSVWTTLQICSSGSYNADGNFILPTKLQERYMIYDAIINGARDLAFYGGNNPNCWSSTDAAFGWNWTFWNTVLKGLIQEISVGSPLGPALVNPGSTRALQASDPTTEVISREGATSGDIWVMAARSGSGSQNVTIGGLPSTVTSGSVYTEGRSVAVSGGSFTDSFGQWDVHVYHFTSTAAPAPTITSFSPTSGPVGTSVTIAGSNLTGASSVTFSGTAATYAVDSDSQITATVPNGAATGPISVTTPGGTATSSASFTVTQAPTITSFSPGSGRVGTKVTIIGTSFTGVTAVAFNGTAATYAVGSDSQITANVPAGATTGPITVTTPGGTAKSSKNFKVRR